MAMNNESIGRGPGMKGGSPPPRPTVANATRKAARQMLAILPILIGVVLLVGLLRAAIPASTIQAVFGGNTLRDTVTGSFLGSILAGNPINSYVIGGQLLADGVSLYAVGAFIVAWVTVGIVQLPAESIALGRKFAFYRNGLAFLVSVPIALIAANAVALLGGIP
jgi:uncharacterized membrane protein YraQ (UPF0718 family)